MKKELQIQLLFCGQIEVKIEDEIKWLGQILSSDGLAGSVAETVAAHEGKIRGACLEIAAVVNDWRARAVAGLESALFLWESVCVPSFIHGAAQLNECSRQCSRPVLARCLMGFGPNPLINGLILSLGRFSL